MNKCQFNLCIQKFSFSMLVESFLSFLVKPNLLVHKLSRSQNVTSHLNISTGCRIMSVKKLFMSLEDCFTTEPKNCWCPDFFQKKFCFMSNLKFTWQHRFYRTILPGFKNNIFRLVYRSNKHTNISTYCISFPTYFFIE